MLSIYTKIADSLIPSIRTRFFSLDNPEQPEFTFSVDAYGNSFIRENLVFVASNYQCYVFEKPEYPVAAIEPIYDFCGISNINDIFFIDYDDIHYLLLSQASHVGVYEYEYTPADANEILFIESDTLSNSPNPFNPLTKITYNLENPGKITLDVFNTKGQKVKSLIDSDQPSGSYEVYWNGIDLNNKQVASGVYFCTLKTERNYVSRKMILLK
jgi:hypothetical protein